MAITTIGFTGSVNEQQFSKLMRLVARSGGADEIVDVGSALAVTIATGTRLVTVGAGDCAASGLMVSNSTSQNVTLPANSSGNPRIDYIVVNIDWVADTATITSVTGSPGGSPVPPALVKTAGTQWQLPLARVTVASGAGQLAGGTVEDCRPVRRQAKEYSVAVSSRTVGTGASDLTLETLDIPDPGWPYLLYCSARVGATNATGRLQIDIQVNGGNLATAQGDNGVTADVVTSGRATGNLTGSANVRLSATSLSLSTSITANQGRLNVMVIPS